MLGHASVSATDKHMTAIGQFELLAVFGCNESNLFRLIQSAFVIDKDCSVLIGDLISHQRSPPLLGGMGFPFSS